MYVLMIGQVTGKEYTEPQLHEEGVFIANAKAEGLVQELYLKADQTGPVMILADVTADQARERMADLPFILQDIATFDYIEMNPRQLVSQPTSHSRSTVQDQPA